MRKNIVQNNNLDLHKYTNNETGETLDSELRGKTITVKSRTELYTIVSKDYVTIDTKALEYICSVLSNSDCTKYTKMAAMLKTEFNIVFNHNIPHDLETLSNALQMDIENLRKMIKRMMKKGLLACVHCAPTGYEQKIYMLNPSVVRKRKTFNKELLIFFKDYTEL